MANVEKHKSTILLSAIKLFRQKGYSATGLNEILSDCDAPKGSLYYYFPGGKESLAVAAVTIAGNRVLRTFEELTNSAKSAESFITAYCSLLANWMKEEDYRVGCPIATVLLETVPESASITKAGQTILESWTRSLEATYRKFDATEQRAGILAEITISMVEGALIQARVLRTTLPLVRAAETIGELIQNRK